VAVNSIYASIIPSYKYNLVLKSFSYGTQVMGHPVLSVSNFSKTFVISTEMQQIGNKKVIHRRTREIICNTFDYMRITFPFEALTKIGFLRICFFQSI
jgi:hypothetical protein